MTERARRGSRAVPVYTVVGASFVVAAGGVGVQMAQGEDPALGAGPELAATAPGPAKTPRRILIRRIEKTVVVTRLLPARPAAGNAAAPVIRATATAAPQRASVAPAPAAAARPAPAPAPVSAPSPAPAPAPVTRSS